MVLESLLSEATSGRHPRSNDTESRPTRGGGISLNRAILLVRAPRFMSLADGGRDRQSDFMTIHPDENSPGGLKNQNFAYGKPVLPVEA